MLLGRTAPAINLGLRSSSSSSSSRRTELGTVSFLFSFFFFGFHVIRKLWKAGLSGINGIYEHRLKH